MARFKERFFMRRFLVALCFLVALPALVGAQTSSSADWKAKVNHDLPLLGHRNWILVVDSAYPLQSSAGVETVETGADQLDVVKYVMDAIGSSIHVRPDIFMDAELPYVQEEDAPGTEAYRQAIAKMFEGQDVQSQLHEKLIGTVDQAGNLVHVLILKTRMTIPYSSVFLRLNCKYWGDEAEERMRVKMGVPAPQEAQPAAETNPQPVPPQPAQQQPTPDQTGQTGTQTGAQPAAQTAPQ
jgi:hypothetical protein